MAKRKRLSVSNQISDLQDVVFQLLTVDPKLRDDDRKLSARIWTNQLGGLDKMREMSAYDFLVAYTGGNSALYSQESIGRARRIVQENHPQLRGKRWQERQAEQSVVKNVLKNL